jgi:hypothetical protein
MKKDVTKFVGEATDVQELKNDGRQPCTSSDAYGLPTEGPSDAESRNGRKSEETPYFQRTIFNYCKTSIQIKDKFRPEIASLY